MKGKSIYEKMLDLTNHQKYTNRYHLTPAWMVIIKKKKMTNIGKDVENGELLWTVGEYVNYYSYPIK